MRVLLITNLAMQWIVIAVIAWRTTLRGRLEWRWTPTFFGKTRCGFYIILWDRPPSEHVSTSGRNIFQLQWRNPKTVTDYPYIREKAAAWAVPAFLRALQPTTNRVE